MAKVRDPPAWDLLICCCTAVAIKAISSVLNEGSGVISAPGIYELDGDARLISV